MKDVIIIGAGTAGLTAAIYALRAGLSILIFECSSPGGKILNSPKIENYPAMPGVTGFDYSMALLNQANDMGAEIFYEKVTGTDFSESIKKVFVGQDEYSAKTVIIANGAFRKKLGCKGETEFEGKGVSYCATCDGNFFKNMDISVIGGGDTAMEDAIYLSGICKTVYVFSNSAFIARDALIEKAKSINNIILTENSKIKEIKGNNSVESIIINIDGKDKEVFVKAVFVAVGISPDNRIFGNQIKTDKNGYIIAGEDCHCSVEGIFVAGDSRTKSLRQLVTAASDGAVSATEAFKYIRNMGGR